MTPAYPGKIKCVPPIPYEVCVQVLNGQIDEAGLRRLGLVTGGRLGEYISDDVTTGAVGTATRYQSGSFGGYGSAAGSSAYGYGGLAGAYAGASAAAASGIGYSSSRSASSVAMSSNIETAQGSAIGRRTSCGSTNDFGDDSGTSPPYLTSLS